MDLPIDQQKFDGGQISLKVRKIISYNTLYVDGKKYKLTMQGKNQSVYIAILIYAISNSAVRVSILYLYRRVFTVSPFRHATTILGITCVTWLVAAEIALNVYRCIDFGTERFPAIA